MTDRLELSLAPADQNRPLLKANYRGTEQQLHADLLSGGYLPVEKNGGEKYWVNLDHHRAVKIIGSNTIND